MESRTSSPVEEGIKRANGRCNTPNWYKKHGKKKCQDRQAKEGSMKEGSGNT